MLINDRDCGAGLRRGRVLDGRVLGPRVIINRAWALWSFHWHFGFLTMRKRFSLLHVSSCTVSMVLRGFRRRARNGIALGMAHVHQ